MVIYDQLELTRFYLKFVHDPDFRAILQAGVGTLNNQIALLEKECTRYEVPLPDRPPAVGETAVDPEILEDRFVFRTMFTGIQYATELHLTAVVETIRNDRIRALFLDLLKEELATLHNFLKYGRAKGWLRVVPIYQTG